MAKMSNIRVNTRALSETHLFTLNLWNMLQIWLRQEIELMLFISISRRPSINSHNRLIQKLRAHSIIGLDDECD